MLHPNLAGIVLVSIAPHTLSNRPIVIPIEAVVTKSMWLLAQNCESFDQLQQRFYRQVNFDTFYH